MNQDPILPKAIKGKFELIRGMHKNSMPLEDIAKFTGLSTVNNTQKSSEYLYCSELYFCMRLIQVRDILVEDAIT